MKALVVYSSQTGNTRKLAQAAYDCLTCEKETHLRWEAAFIIRTARPFFSA